MLRGSVQHGFAHDGGTTRLQASAELKRHDVYFIEDDAALALSSETTLHPAEWLELRGGLFFRHLRDGDDLAIGDAVIGTTTPKNIGGAVLQAGADIGQGRAIVAEASFTAERPGDTTFQNRLVAPLRLEADMDRWRVAAGLTQALDGSVSLGASAALDVAVARAPEHVPAFSARVASVNADLRLRDPSGGSLDLSAGLQRLDAERGLLTELRPTYAIALSLPLPGDATLRASLAGSYELADTDDPLASWRRRAELELAGPVIERLTLGAGLFDEARRNVALGNREFAQGGYLRGEWSVSEHIALYARLDATHRRITLLDIEKRALTTRLGMRKRL